MNVSNPSTQAPKPPRFLEIDVSKWERIATQVVHCTELRVMLSPNRYYNYKERIVYLSHCIIYQKGYEERYEKHMFVTLNRL